MKKSLHARVNRREEVLRARFAKLRREIDAGVIGGEDGRLWLEQFCEGEGVQLCCGDFSLGDSLGVDQDRKMLATDLWANADQFPGDGLPLDYIVTNYLECFPAILQTLSACHRELKPGGVLAIVCRDAEMYSAGMGPLENRNRVSCFTETVLRCYLTRAGFEIFRIDRDGKELRVAARRR